MQQDLCRKGILSYLPILLSSRIIHCLSSRRTRHWTKIFRQISLDLLNPSSNVHAFLQWQPQNLLYSVAFFSQNGICAAIIMGLDFGSTSTFACQSCSLMLNKPKSAQTDIEPSPIKPGRGQVGWCQLWVGTEDCIRISATYATAHHVRKFGITIFYACRHKINTDMLILRWNELICRILMDKWTNLVYEIWVLANQERVSTVQNTRLDRM